MGAGLGQKKCKVLTKIVQDFCAEYKLAGVELDDCSVSQQLGTLQQHITAWHGVWKGGQEQLTQINTADPQGGLGVHTACDHNREGDLQQLGVK